MLRNLFFALFFIVSVGAARAQVDSSRLYVSLLTCGTGPESWETFGHTAVRITDSLAGTDNVYNYGTFSFGDDFIMQFMRGKLLYYLSYYPYSNFLEEYRSANRSVSEQTLLLSGEKKKELYAFLNNNAREENRYYKYDFFFDNCATRLRDVFPNSLGKDFQFGTTIAANNRITFRNIINRYYYKKHWERLGVNILLGSRIDSVMTNNDIMFLPDYLQEGITKATVNGKKIATTPEVVVTGQGNEPAGLNGPLLLMTLIAVLTIAGLSFPTLKQLGNAMQFIVLFVTGLLGVLILVMWFATDHQGCQNNFNILWALPTNLFLGFASKRNKDKYAIIAILLILVSFVLHILKVQEMLLLEFSPLLLALIWIFGTIYRRSKLNSYGK